MHFGWHMATATSFLIAGDPIAALGCVAPDIAWVPNEVRFRLSGVKNWEQWSESNLSPRWTAAYRMTHSMLASALLLIAFWDVYPIRHMLAGWTLHQILDLPSHSGVMTQRPLWPFPWRWTA